MKKYFGFLAVALLAATLTLTEAFAQPGGKGKMNGKTGTTGSRFVDANGDGVCDNNLTGQPGAGMMNRGAVRPNFVDADGDGVCDLNNSETTGSRSGKRGQLRPNFVDEDGDGVCDHFVTVQPAAAPVKTK